MNGRDERRQSGRRSPVQPRVDPIAEASKAKIRNAFRWCIKSSVIEAVLDECGYDFDKAQTRLGIMEIEIQEESWQRSEEEKKRMIVYDDSVFAEEWFSQLPGEDQSEASTRLGTPDFSPFVHKLRRRWEAIYEPPPAPVVPAPIQVPPVSADAPPVSSAATSIQEEIAWDTQCDEMERHVEQELNTVFPELDVLTIRKVYELCEFDVDATITHLTRIVSSPSSEDESEPSLTPSSAASSSSCGSPASPLSASPSSSEEGSLLDVEMTLLSDAAIEYLLASRESEEQEPMAEPKDDFEFRQTEIERIVQQQRAAISERNTLISQMEAEAQSSSSLFQRQPKKEKRSKSRSRSPSSDYVPLFSSAPSTRQTMSLRDARSMFYEMSLQEHSSRSKSPVSMSSSSSSSVAVKNIVARPASPTPPSASALAAAPSKDQKRSADRGRSPPKEKSVEKTPDELQRRYLSQVFVRTKKETIEEVFARNGGRMKDTVRELQKMEKWKLVIRSVPASASSPLSSGSAPLSAFDDSAKMIIEAQDARAEALALRINISTYSRMLQYARHRMNYSSASEYSSLINKCYARIQELHSYASNVFFEANNPAPRSERCIDLHGQFVSEALAKLEQTIFSMRLDESDADGGLYLDVVTGVGNNSHLRKARLMPSIKLFCSEKKYPCSELSPGILRIVLHKRW